MTIIVTTGDSDSKKHRYTWDMVDRLFFTQFLTFLEPNDYIPSAQNKYLIDLRVIVNYAYLDCIHDKDRATQYFSKKKIEEGDKAIEIYLTEAELQALYEMLLTGKPDEVRDIFLVGCYTCQRVSDYNDIAKDSFTITAKRHTNNPACPAKDQNGGNNSDSQRQFDCPL